MEVESQPTGDDWLQALIRSGFLAPLNRASSAGVGEGEVSPPRFPQGSGGSGSGWWGKTEAPI